MPLPLALKLLDSKEKLKFSGDRVTLVTALTLGIMCVPLSEVNNSNL